jgi:hypothetical protein
MIIMLLLPLASCGGETTVDDASGVAPTDTVQAVSTPPPAPPDAEPTEDEMRALEKAAIDELNAKGGFVIQMSGAQSKPIKIKLISYRKIGCKPYTRAFRCEALVGFSYPGTELPNETLPGSHRYRKDDQSRWTRD